MAQCMPWPKVTQWQCSSRSVSKKRPTRPLGKGNIPLFEWLRVSSIKSSDRVYFLVKRLVFRGGCVLSCASSCGMETEISYNYIALSSSTGWKRRTNAGMNFSQRFTWSRVPEYLFLPKMCHHKWLIWGTPSYIPLYTQANEDQIQISAWIPPDTAGRVAWRQWSHPW